MSLKALFDVFYFYFGGLFNISNISPFRGFKVLYQYKLLPGISLNKKFIQKIILFFKAKILKKLFIKLFFN
jgi:uncharacterized membrane protein YjjP (DUF1212 family)